MLNLQPLFDRVIVRPIAPEEQRGGIIIPATAIDRPQQGEVVAVGEGVVKDGVSWPPRVGVGDKILFGKFAGCEIEVEGQNYFIMREEEILAVFHDKAKTAGV